MPSGVSTETLVSVWKPTNQKKTDVGNRSWPASPTWHDVPAILSKKTGKIMSVSPIRTSTNRTHVCTTSAFEKLFLSGQLAKYCPSCAY